MIETIIKDIQEAFSSVVYPGDWCLRGSDEGDEPYAVERSFRGKTDPWKIDPTFLDRAPDGLGSALSFLSDEAFRFFIQAYLVADLRGLLERSNPTFTLTHGLSDTDFTKRVNPSRYGERTWGNDAIHKFSMFNCNQVNAIVSYLKYMQTVDSYESPRIQQALDRYWLKRLAKCAQQGD